MIPAEKENKVQIWIVLRSDIEKELAEDKAEHFEDIFINWKKNAPVGIFWTAGKCNNIHWMDYLITENFMSLSNNNLLKKWRDRPEGRTTVLCTNNQKNFMFVFMNQNKNY